VPAPAPVVAATQPSITGTAVPTATVTQVLVAALTLTPQAVTAPQVGPATVPAPTSGTPVARSISAELVTVQAATPARSLALTGLDSRWMLLLAAFAMALGALALRLTGPATTRCRITERTSR